MTSRKQMLHRARQRLAAAAEEEPALDARLLLLHLLDISHEDLIRDGDMPMSEVEQAAYEALVARREAHEPMAYILGYRDFWKDRFELNEDTLIPRPDSESLIEAVVEGVRIQDLGFREGVFCEEASADAAVQSHIKEPRDMPLSILDICTGSGCLLISLLREFPHAKGVGCDISHSALTMAQRNAQTAGMGARTQFFCGDMIKSLASTFDIIVSNPPYISRSDMAALEKQVRGYEPHRALEGGEDGLDFYRQLAKETPALLNENGIIALEMGHDQSDAVSALMQKDFELIQQQRDLGGHIRTLVFKRV